MTREEKKLESLKKELEKQEARLARAQKTLDKRTAEAQKYGVAEMDIAEHTEWLSGRPNENGFLTSKEDIKTNSAWFDLRSAQMEVEDIQNSIERTKKQIEKYSGKVEAQEQQTAEDARVADMESKFHTMTAEERAKKQEEYEAWKQWFIAECKKDGITITDISGRWFEGFTASGKRFWIYGNSGFTQRGFHCYTLRINGNTVFTSGDFGTAYNYIRK